MFCGKCGAQLPEGATSCSRCGQAVPASSGASAAKDSASAAVGKAADYIKSIDFKNPKVLGIIAIALVVLVAVFMLFGGQSYKKAVNNFMEGVFDADAKQVLKAVPDELIDYMCEEEDMTKREMIKQMDEMLEEMIEEIEYYAGDNWSVKHKIVDTEKLDRDDLEDLKEMYEEVGIKVKDAKIVIVEMTVQAGMMSQSMDLEVGVIKVGGSWYVDVENVDLPF